MARQPFRFSPSEWHARPEVQRLTCEAKGCLIEFMWIAEFAKRFGYLEMPNGAPITTTVEGGKPYNNLAMAINYYGRGGTDLSYVMQMMFTAGALEMDSDGDFFIPWMVSDAEGKR